MIEFLIRWSIANRFLVVILALILAVAGVMAIRTTPLDAIPDLSDVQVIVKTTYPGQAPQVVEDQVTYPLATAMLSVPGAVSVRGYSFFNDSYVYVIFKDGTDLYWARARVLEYLSQVAPNLPEGARPALGPDATGVGWVFQYALVDRTGQQDGYQLRALQDWFLKYELQAVEGVSEVATIGGMVKQYQVVADPNKLRAHGISLSRLRRAIERGNQETGGRVIEMAEAEYVIRANGYVSSIADLAQIPLHTDEGGTPVLLRDVAEIRLGPDLRRGVSELGGEGEAVGGVVVMRYGENALATIDRVKEKLASLEKSLPEGVEIVTTYDRSALIGRAASTLREKLIEEFIIVALVCAVFLFHFRSSLVVVISLPLGVLAAFIVMRAQGINANIMSLGGIIIAVGTMVDAAIVMIENAHKKLEGREASGPDRWKIIGEACAEVGPPIFFSVLIITLSFLPILTLEAQEGRMFSPLAYTKTYAMAASAALSVTLVPVLIGFLVRGRITSEDKNPVNRFLTVLYRPLINFAVARPLVVLAASGVLLVSAALPLSRIGSEFMPELNEGDLLYMPSAFPGASAGTMSYLLQQTNKLIKMVPEVENVHGKAGRADTATDPAPLSMIETVIRLKPRSQWREDMTLEKLKVELNRIVDIPGLTNVWIMPIKNRLDMLATGIKTPVGIKVAGPDLNVIDQIGSRIESILETVDGTSSVYAERVTGGRFVDIDIDRERAARLGLNIADVHDVIRTAIGGMVLGESVEGLERFPISLRYPQTVRQTPAALRLLPIVTEDGAHIPLGQVADIRTVEGPSMIRSENARLNGWIYVDIAGRDIGSYVADAKEAVNGALDLPAGYSISWSGQYEYLLRAQERLMLLGPVMVLIIAMLLYFAFKDVRDVLIIMGTLPFALVGSLWLIDLLGYNLSVAVAVGFIALAGVAIEVGVLMIMYLRQELKALHELALNEGRAPSREEVENAIRQGALRRLRPIVMTFLTVIAGLLPVMLLEGTGTEVMAPIAAPMIGGILSATALALIVIPSIYALWHGGAAERRDV
ncbi:efflux RND transporter permease subunit [Pyruvatibacter mobilis]|uniref:efflux RND transporter permease subunit n=1 Tax=Pyruvatibacter mobilis TaxID=1712261 RepID=UPI003C7B47AF